MKYIIDVPEDRVHGDRLCAMGIMEDSLSHYLPTGIKAIPYDESTLADIKSGKGLPPIHTQSNTGSTSSGLTSEQRGQEEAWELATKIFEMSNKDRSEANIPISQWHWMQYSEAHEKYEAWKKQKDEELHVGDEVNVYDGKAVLLDKVVDGWFVMNENGTVETFRNREISGKTGQHFDEVAELLKKLRELS